MSRPLDIVDIVDIVVSGSPRISEVKHEVPLGSAALTVSAAGAPGEPMPLCPDAMSKCLDIAMSKLCLSYV